MCTVLLPPGVNPTAVNKYIDISISVRWAGHVARLGERRGVYRVLLGNLKERDHLGDLGVDGRIILRWIFWKWDVGARTGSSLLMIGTVGGHL